MTSFLMLWVLFWSWGVIGSLTHKRIILAIPCAILALSPFIGETEASEAKTPIIEYSTAKTWVRS